MLSFCVIGITAVSTRGVLIKDIVILETKGGSGDVMILNLIFPVNLVSSPLISTAAFNCVLNLMDTPGGVVERLLSKVVRVLLALALRENSTSPNYKNCFILLVTHNDYFLFITALTMQSLACLGVGEYI